MTHGSDVQERHITVMVPREPNLSRGVAKTVAEMAQRFQSDIHFSAGAVQIDAKSRLITFTLLEALKGQVVEVTARGSDSALAVRDLSRAFDGGNAL